MTGMVGPTWLAAGVAVLMLGASVCALARILIAWRTRTATDYAIEICHAVMGVSMAGMLVPALYIVTPGPSVWIWTVVQAIITVWFIVSVIRELRAGGRATIGRVRRLHHLPHVVLSAAMVYMLSVLTRPAVGGAHTAHAMSGMGMDHGSLLPAATLDLVFACFLIGYTVVLGDRLFPRTRVEPLGEPSSLGEPSVLGPASSGTVRLLAPRGAVGLGMVMSFGMSYMLVMMFA